MAVVIGLLVLAFAALVGALVLSASTALAGIEGRTFGKALTATVLATIAIVIVGVPLSLLGFDDEGLVASVVGLVTYLAVIRAVYATSWGKAFLAWILQLVVILLLVLPFVALGGIAAILR